MSNNGNAGSNGVEFNDRDAGEKLVWCANMLVMDDAMSATLFIELQTTSVKWLFSPSVELVSSTSCSIVDIKPD